MAPSIYLINPRTDVPFYFGMEAHEAWGFGKAVLMADAAIATVAGMAPPDFHLTLCDEGISPVDFDTPAEFVGITGKVSQENRMVDLAREFRKRGKIVICGGPFASLSPAKLRKECDILVRGELENIAEQFFSDLRAGTWQREYIGDKPDLRASPIPRWDLYSNHRALAGTLQTSRGCPFECEFCDVIQYLGRKQRHKSPEQVLRELDVLYAIGYRSVFLADDNLTVFRARAKELLTAIRDWNEARTAGRMRFSTQVSIDCARDEELLRLCGEAGLATVFIGIESPNADSLKETKKRQNIGVDMAAQVGRFAANGMMVTGGMMLGFDSDGLDIFERQYEFGMSLPVPMFTVTPVSAPEATPLHARLSAENRLTEYSQIGAVLPWTTNIIPKQMTHGDLVAGVQWLCNRLYRPAAFEHRVARFIDLFQPTERGSQQKSPPPSREVDRQRIEMARHITRLGPSEASMAARLERRVQQKPEALPLVLLALGYYMQARHMFNVSGLWNPRLAAQKQPQFDRAQETQGLVPVPSTPFTILNY
ncbi:MAG TPA: radical SAM protein [Bryobacteraceae bacterium]|nr:radical SAM protein [Bryobacteraceae bacterium]